MVWSFSKLTLQFLVASRVNVIWLTCYDFWKRGGQQLAKTSILTLFLGDQAQSTSHQECMVEVDKKMCPSGDHPFLASRLLLLQCQSKNAFEQKTKIPSFFRKDPHCSQTLIFVLKSTTIQVFLDKKEGFAIVWIWKEGLRMKSVIKTYFAWTLNFLTILGNVLTCFHKSTLDLTSWFL